MKFVYIFFILASLLFSEENKKTEEWLSGSDLEAYKTSYFCPLSYRDEGYDSYLKDTQFRHLEVEVQISLKYELLNNPFGFNGKYYAAYSQHAFWQIYAHSKPFRENVYNPELFAKYDMNIQELPSLKSLQIGYEHQSNGNPDTTDSTIDGVAIGNISRDINTLYAHFGFVHERLHTDLQVWVPVFSLDDNPDIMDYIGYTGIKMKYFYNHEIFSLSARGNLATKKGSLEISYAYPIGRSVNLYTKFFTGYTETLIDYKDYVNKFSLGFSFSN